MVNALNKLLRIEKGLKLPSFRRTVTVSGKNVHWLHKNIGTFNNGYNPEIDHLLTELVAA